RKNSLFFPCLTGKWPPQPTETGSLQTTRTAIRFLDGRGAQKFQHESPEPVVEFNLLARGQGGPHAVHWGHKHG
ncbi:MAG: hypothetical protein V3T80_05895, partial [Kiloniellales bacterium]